MEGRVIEVQWRVGERMKSKGDLYEDEHEAYTINYTTLRFSSPYHNPVFQL